MCHSVVRRNDGVTTTKAKNKKPDKKVCFVGLQFFV